MQAELINPFVKAVLSTFRTMLNAEARRGELSLGHPCKRMFPVSGIIGLSGKTTGTVVLNLSTEVAISAASAMLMEEIEEVNPDVIDAVGELANVVAGQAKVELAELDLSLSMPSVVTGEGHAIRFPSSAPPVQVSFDTDYGPMLLEVGFEPSTIPAGA